MAVIQNNKDCDRHLVVFDLVNAETGEGTYTEYVIPHKKMDRQDMTKILIDDKGVEHNGKRTVPDDFLEKVKQNRSVRALFEDGSLTLVAGDAPMAEKREPAYDRQIAQNIQSIQDKANARLVVPGKSK